MTPAPRILIVEDEVDARELLARGLNRQGFAADGASDGQNALELLPRDWDVVVTDLLMPRLDGLGLLKELSQRLPHALRVVITSFGDKERVLAALNLGADYLLEKPFSALQLGDVITRLLAERNDDENQIDQLFVRRLAGLPLTPRERDLVVLVMKGLGNKDIARQLDLSEQTVKNALFALYQKLGIASRSELFHLVFPI
ncbi:MAG: response regulator transcription factor [Planctomycetes bacterium]|nr:response regulator transcription factor [Planctomycetota bacterium]